jgi:hypothetical protein
MAAVQPEPWLRALINNCNNIRMLWPEFEAVCFIIQARRFGVGPEQVSEEIVKLTQ